MMLLPMLRLIRYLERSISRAVSNDIAEGRGSAKLSENEHSVNFWGLSSRIRSAAPRSMMPVRREKEN